MFNTSVTFLSLAVFSLFVALSREVNLAFFLPVCFAFFVAIFGFGVGFCVCENACETSQKTKKTAKTAKKTLFAIAKRIFVANLFVVCFAASAYFFGEPRRAILIFLRANLLIAFAAAIFVNSDAFRLASMTTKHFKKLGFLLFFSLKFIEILKNEFAKRQKTLKARGFSPKTNKFTLKTEANLVGILLTASLFHAETLNKALKIRGFQMKFYHEKERFYTHDFVLFLLVFLVALLQICGFAVWFS